MAAEPGIKFDLRLVRNGHMVFSFHEVICTCQPCHQKPERPALLLSPAFPQSPPHATHITMQGMLAMCIQDLPHSIMLKMRSSMSMDINVILHM